MFVPVRAGVAGCRVMRIFRRPDGVRTGVAFTSRAALTGVMGPDALYAELSLGALRAMLAEVGVGGVLVDPDIVVGTRHAVRLVS